MKKLRLLFFTSAIFLIGVFGGMTGSNFSPWLVGKFPALSNLRIFGGMQDRVTIVKEREEVIIDKADAIQRSIKKVTESVVVVERRNQGIIQSDASALVVTSDGWIVAPIIVTQGSGSPNKNEFFILRRGETISAKLIKTDSSLNLALFSVEGRNFTTPEFASWADASLGDTVFLLGALTAETFENSLEVSYISRLTASSMDFAHNLGSSSPAGASLFTTEGKLLSLSFKNSRGMISFIPASKISEFISSAHSTSF